jgi:transcriptional regulator with XRE-family HTH domain
MALAENIKVRRSVLKMSQSELAKKSGVSQQLIGALESGKINSTRSLQQIASALHCEIRDLDQRIEMNSIYRNGIEQQLESANRLPVFGSEVHRDDPSCISVFSQPIDQIVRSTSLEFVRGAYALIIPQDQMVPEFEIGDLVLVNPHLPPTENSTCIIYREAESDNCAVVVRLLDFTSSCWNVKVWNSPKTHGYKSTLDRNRWTKYHRIVGRYCRR